MPGGSGGKQSGCKPELGLVIDSLGLCFLSAVFWFTKPLNTITFEGSEPACPGTKLLSFAAL